MELIVKHTDHCTPRTKVDIIGKFDSWEAAWWALYEDNMSRYASATSMAFYDRESWMQAVEEGEEDHPEYYQGINLEEAEHGVWSDGYFNNRVAPAEYNEETVTRLLELADGYSIEEYEEEEEEEEEE